MTIQSTQNYDTSDTVTESTVTTPTTSVFSDQDDPELRKARTVQAGHIYVIRSMSCGRQITLYKGKVVFADQNSLGSAYWMCVETNGWLGFRNLASYNFLRHGGGAPGLHCSHAHHKLWERMQIRPHESVEGGYALLSEYWQGLRPIGIIKHEGKETLNRIVEPGTNSLAWEFLEVPEPSSG